ncbi:MAG: class II glutamine amidotransferase [Candidatus Humimicrobiaceae bacterium]
MKNNFLHECDLFLMSSYKQYHANKALYNFGKYGKRNIDGWGIGFYNKGKSHIIKSSESIQDPRTGNLNNEFSEAIKEITSTIILGHLRFASKGAVKKENNHPFSLNFLNYDWLFVHNGTAHNTDKFESPAGYLLKDSTTDSARVFEFMRKNIIDYSSVDPKHSLIEACRNSYSKLLKTDPSGTYNIILSNGYISFVFIHWRKFYMLDREKDTGNALLISTIKLTENEEWIEFENRQKARMLVFNGPTLIFNGNINTVI